MPTTINYTLSRDANGNRLVRVKPANRNRGFSIQSNGNLPRTHHDGITEATAGEVRRYVWAFGTDRQRAIVGPMDAADRAHGFAEHGRARLAQDGVAL